MSETWDRFLNIIYIPYSMIRNLTQPLLCRLGLHRWVDSCEWCGITSWDMCMSCTRQPRFCMDCGEER